jgi:UDP-N-acetyl-D-glucosamine/UDP-N-acetyl-D-galactosamine dehydrogenase
VEEPKAGHDWTREVDANTLRAALHLDHTTDPERLTDAYIFIVVVPTPIDRANGPEVTLMECA